MFKYCPACGSKKITFTENKKWQCGDCGLEYYHNTAAACGAIIECRDAILLVERGKEPGAGLLDLPGGFADPGEGIVDALLRECREELGWEPPLNTVHFLTSFANVYPYKGFVYNTCDSYFTIDAGSLSHTDLTLQQGEIAGVQFFKHDAVPFDKLAFVSVNKALRFYYDTRH